MRDTPTIESRARQELPPVFTARNFSSLLNGTTSEARRQRVIRMARIGEITRLARDRYSLPNTDRRVLANYLVPHSYISFEMALSYYGIIPEAVHTVTSCVLRGRSTRFRTPIGIFSYRTQGSVELFSQGMTQVTIGNRSCLMATPEKAILDTLAYRDIEYHQMTQSEFHEFVIDGLRFDEDVLQSLDIEYLQAMSVFYRSRSSHLIVNLIREVQS